MYASTNIFKDKHKVAGDINSLSLFVSLLENVQVYV